MIGFYEPYWDQPDEELEHFGVKGMKWGVRRYQNKDGTLTEAGKKKRAKDQKKLTYYYEQMKKHRDESITDDMAGSMLRNNFNREDLARHNEISARSERKWMSDYNRWASKQSEKMLKRYGSSAFDGLDMDSIKAGQKWCSWYFDKNKNRPKF